MLRGIIAVGLLVGVGCTVTVAEEPFVAWLADGTRVESPSLPSWPMLDGAFRLGNQELMSVDNPVRLLVDRRQRAELKPPYVVLANGDVLPGTLLGLEALQGRVSRVPRVLISPEPPLLPLQGSSIAVRSDRIRRIVLAQNATAIAPPEGTVVLINGRRLAARSIRFTDRGLTVLTEDAVENVEFRDLADVVMPGIEVTAAVLEDNWWTAGNRDLAIARVQVTTGALLTTARIFRDQNQDRRRGRVLSAVVYCVQPAWAEEPLAVPESDIVCCGYRSGNEAPLGLLPASTLRSKRLIAPASPWRSSPTEEGGLLAAGDRLADTGIATRSETAIAFDLPREAESLVAAVGIDPLMGSGGCVRCKVAVLRDEGEKTLWDGGFLQGKDGVQSTGPLDVAGAKQAVLVTEFAHEGRPPGADPLDIRDQVAWLSPMLRLSSDSGGTARRTLTVLPGAEDWSIESDAWPKVQVTSRWNAAASQWDGVLTVPESAAVVFKRKWNVTAASDVVELLTVCPANLEEHDFTLRVDGDMVPWHNNADRNQIRQWTLRYSRTRGRDGEQETNLSERLAYWWDLSPWRGKDVEVALTVTGKRERNEIAWRDLCLRAAVGNLPARGERPKADVLLTSLEPVSSDPRARRITERDEQDDQPIRFLGQRFDNGYILARDARVSFALKPEFKRLVGVIGCCTQVAGPVQILIDDRVVWERSALSALAPAESIDLPIPAGAKQLTLACGSDSLYYGYAALAEAGFVAQ